jgi:tetratricopeptide (TPR) repeat protein
MTMRRVTVVLAAVVAIELGVVASAAAERLGRPSLPPPDTGHFNERDEMRDALPAQFELAAARVRDEGTAAAWLSLCGFYLTIGYYPEAEACARRAAAVDRTSFDAVFALGICLDLMGRVQEAIFQFERANDLTDARRDHRAWFMLARGWLKLERVDDAIAAFARAPGFPPIQFQLARLLVRAGRLDEAAPLCAELGRVHPGCLELLTVAADLAEQRGDLERAAQLRAEAANAGTAVGYNPAAQAVRQLRWDLTGRRR